MRLGWHIFAKPTEGSPCKRKKKRLDRNDDIGVFKSTPGPEVDRKKKKNLLKYLKIIDYQSMLKLI